jgi:hypothetical protein
MHFALRLFCVDLFGGYLQQNFVGLMFWLFATIFLFVPHKKDFRFNPAAIPHFNVA